MKRFNALLTALLFIGLNNANSQVLQIQPSDSFSYIGTLSTITDNYESLGFFVNNSGASKTLFWRVISTNMDSLWSMSFCDPQNCYYFTTATTNYSTNQFLADTGSNQLRFGVSPYCSADSGKMVVLAWFTNDSAASVKTLYFNASYTGSCVSAIQNPASPQLYIFPNPVNATLTVDGLSNYKNVKLTVYDVLGNIVIEKTITQPSAIATLNTSTLQQGVYFVTVDSNGARLLTKRVQKLD